MTIIVPSATIYAVGVNPLDLSLLKSSSMSLSIDMRHDDIAALELFHLFPVDKQPCAFNLLECLVHWAASLTTEHELGLQAVVLRKVVAVLDFLVDDGVVVL